MTMAALGHCALLGRVTQPTKARASLLRQRHDPPYGRRHQPGQHRCLLRPRIRRAAVVVAIAKSPTLEQAPNSRLHWGQHLRHIQRGETRHRVKRQGARALSREDAVQHERVDMHIQIERSTELL